LGLAENILRGTQDAGFNFCTPIQAKCLPLPSREKTSPAKRKPEPEKPPIFYNDFPSPPAKRYHRPETARALIIAPTRELAIQISEESKTLGKYTTSPLLPFFGGLEYKKQEKILQEGIDIVVATPGRLIDYLKQQVVSLDTSKY